jgi:hypothetical protein
MAYFSSGIIFPTTVLASAWALSHEHGTTGAKPTGGKATAAKPRPIIRIVLQRLGGSRTQPQDGRSDAPCSRCAAAGMSIQLNNSTRVTKCILVTPPSGISGWQVTTWGTEARRGASNLAKWTKWSTKVENEVERFLLDVWCLDPPDLEILFDKGPWRLLKKCPAS